MRQAGYHQGADLSATEILAKPMLVSLDQLGDITDVARGLDNIAGSGTFLGGLPNGDTYEALEAVSLEREQRLASVIDQMVFELLKTENLVASGHVAAEMATQLYGSILLKTRNQICLVEPELARESIGETAYNKYKEVIQMIDDNCSQLDIDMCIREAEKEAEDVYVCGMSVGKNGEEEGSGCAEIKNGQIGQCPGCKHYVSIIVEGANKDKLYCPRLDCKLSKLGGRKLIGATTHDKEDA
jgi:hypothetical protein